MIRSRNTIYITEYPLRFTQPFFVGRSCWPSCTDCLLLFVTFQSFKEARQSRVVRDIPQEFHCARSCLPKVYQTVHVNTRLQVTTTAQPRPPIARPATFASSWTHTPGVLYTATNASPLLSSPHGLLPSATVHKAYLSCFFLWD